jgi:DeoR/GlpR family transcriptional regulator of sugar metabolism
MERKMKTSEREQQIIALLGERSFISVRELSELLYTSPSSIRRDLSRLEALGIVKRNYGGVVAVAGNVDSAPVSIRSEVNKSAKRTIAKKAAALLRDGMTVLLDDTTSSAAMIEFIAEHRDISLFTNNIETAARAVECGIETYLLGGALPTDSATVTVGRFAVDMLRSIHADLCFFSATALSSEGEIFDSTEQHDLLRREMLRRSAITVFLCDGSKFLRTSRYRVTDLDAVDYLCTDVPLPSEIQTGKAKVL